MFTPVKRTISSYHVGSVLGCTRIVKVDPTRKDSLPKDDTITKSQEPYPDLTLLKGVCVSRLY